MFDDAFNKFRIYQWSLNSVRNALRNGKSFINQCWSQRILQFYIQLLINAPNTSDKASQSHFLFISFSIFNIKINCFSSSKKIIKIFYFISKALKTWWWKFGCENLCDLSLKQKNSQILKYLNFAPVFALIGAPIFI